MILFHWPTVTQFAVLYYWSLSPVTITCAVETPQIMRVMQLQWSTVEVLSYLFSSTLN
jgi:hypothetical protein